MEHKRHKLTEKYIREHDLKEYTGDEINFTEIRPGMHIVVPKVGTDQMIDREIKTIEIESINDEFDWLKIGCIDGTSAVLVYRTTTHICPEFISMKENELYLLPDWVGYEPLIAVGFNADSFFFWANGDKLVGNNLNTLSRFRFVDNIDEKFDKVGKLLVGGTGFDKKHCQVDGIFAYPLEDTEGLIKDK